MFAVMRIMRIRRVTNRRGFTLVELLVAVVLIDIGVLALVSGSAVVVRRTNEIRIRTAAERAAANRIQLLAAGVCAPASGSSPAGRDITEYWAAEPSVNGVRELRDSVAFRLGGEPRSVVLRTRLPC